MSDLRFVSFKLYHSILLIRASLGSQGPPGDTRGSSGDARRPETAWMTTTMRTWTTGLMMAMARMEEDGEKAMNPQGNQKLLLAEAGGGGGKGDRG